MKSTILFILFMSCLLSGENGARADIVFASPGADSGRIAQETSEEKVAYNDRTAFLPDRPSPDPLLSAKDVIKGTVISIRMEKLGVAGAWPCFVKFSTIKVDEIIKGSSPPEIIVKGQDSCLSSSVDCPLIAGKKYLLALYNRGKDGYYRSSQSSCRDIDDPAASIDEQIIKTPGAAETLNRDIITSYKEKILSPEQAKEIADRIIEQKGYNVSEFELMGEAVYRPRLKEWFLFYQKPLETLPQKGKVCLPFEKDGYGEDHPSPNDLFKQTINNLLYLGHVEEIKITIGDSTVAWLIKFQHYERVRQESGIFDPVQEFSYARLNIETVKEVADSHLRQKGINLEEFELIGVPIYTLKLNSWSLRYQRPLDTDERKGVACAPKEQIVSLGDVEEIWITIDDSDPQRARISREIRYR